MTPSARQLGLLLLLLSPVPAMTASLPLSAKQSGLQVVIQQALVSLVRGPLRGHDLLLVSDDHSHRLVDVGEIVEAAGSSNTPVLLASPNSLLHTDRPDHHTKGSLLTALILFYDDPTEFFLLLDDKKQWNPGYLILFCLDPSLNTTAVINQPVVQRSEFLLLLQPDDHTSRRRLLAYTSVLARVKEPMGYYNHTKFPTRHLLFPHRFLDFGGKVLEVPVFCADEPFLYEDETGYCIGGNSDALQVIGDQYNFKHITVHLENLRWAVKENGTWMGTVGELIYKGKDIVINSMKLNPDGFADFDFTYPYWRYNFGMILSIPPPIPRWRNILYPFSPVLWGMVILTTVISASVLSFLVHRFNGVSDPVDIALKVVSGLFGQAMNDRRIRDFPWARVWLIFWWLVVDILAAAYMSNLMSVLTVPAFPKRIKTLEEVAASDVIPCMVDYGSFVPQALKVSQNPIYSTLGDRMYLDPIIYLLDPYGFLLEKVVKGTHGLIVSIDYLVYTQNWKNLTDSTYIVDEKLYRDYMSWFLPRNTPYTSIISNGLQRIVENGILDSIYDKHMAKVTSQKTRIRGSGVLSLNHLQGAFIALGLGAAAGALVLLVERIVHPSSKTPRSTLSTPALSPMNDA